MSEAAHANARSCKCCRAVMVRLVAAGRSAREVDAMFDVGPQTVYKWLRRHQEGGEGALTNRTCRPHRVNRKYPPPTVRTKKELFSVLHAPPSEYGLNRTTWRIPDLVEVMQTRGHPVNEPMVSKLIRDGGYRWRQARVVLTSNDPKFREKLDRVKRSLSRLRDDEAFFSVDEFGPFAVRMRGGRALVPPGGLRSVPQWQKSKGALIVTAALELSQNQITHLLEEEEHCRDAPAAAKALP